MRLTTKLGVAVVVVAATVVVALNVYDRLRMPAFLAEYLNIHAAPSTLKVLECDSPDVMTDFLLTCSIEIASPEFQLLLAGYDFSRREVAATSHSIPVNADTKVGPLFDVTALYVAQPKQFAHGGHVLVYANAEHDKAVMDFYVE